MGWLKAGPPRHRGYQVAHRAAGLRVPCEQEELRLSSFSIYWSDKDLCNSSFGIYAVPSLFTIPSVRRQLTRSCGCIASLFNILT